MFADIYLSLNKYKSSRLTLDSGATNWIMNGCQCNVIPMFGTWKPTNTQANFSPLLRDELRFP